MKLLLSPHNDDEALFASYIAIRERPRVITVLDGRLKRTYPAPAVRVEESRSAMEILGCTDYEHLGFESAITDWSLVADRLAEERDVDHVWAPMAEPRGHGHHNAIAQVALAVFGVDRVSFYSTYMIETSGWPTRTVHGHMVEEGAGCAALKRRALARYETQISNAGTRMHFRRSLDEYEASSIRLNLGGGINPIPGYVNLDKSNGWQFEDGLDCYPDGSVEAITVSHALMYVQPEYWPFVFAEFRRVLQLGGVVRITEDAIGAPGSSRQERRPHAALATDPEIVLEHLAVAGLDAAIVGENETRFGDQSLIQQNYGAEPDVFHAEARRAA